MSSLPDIAHQRGLLPRPHSRKEASDEPCPPCCPRRQGLPVNDCTRAEQRAAQSFPQDRAAGIQSHESEGCGNREGGDDGAGASSPDKGGRHAPATVYERMGTKKGATKQGVPVSHCK